MEDTTTNPNYWDCECPSDYIHAKAVNYCNACGGHQDDAPDSRESELAPRLRCDVGILCQPVNRMVIKLTCCVCGCGRAFCDWCSRTYHIVQRRQIEDKRRRENANL